MRELLGVVLALCAGAQISYAKKLVGSTVLGIDLGGNFMKAAYVAPGEDDPFPILLSDLSERKSPYAVAFRKGKWLFGTHASKAAISNPESTFTHIGSHLLGRQWGSPQVEYYRSTYIPRLDADPARGTVMALDAEGKSVPVEFLAGIYLENLKEHSESVSSRRFSGAVITIPSYYDQLQRQALLEAAEIAGVKVYALINSASAAAIYYGTQVFNGATPQNVLVFDSGATGTSAVVAQIDPAFKAGVGKPMTSIEIKSVATDMLLSGHNIDIRLARILAERFEKDNPGVRVEPGKTFNRLLVEAIRVKNVLSANTEIITGVEDLVGEHSLSSRVSREELEGACADMVPTVEAVVQEALQKAGLTMEDIALVIPVGGNSRVPFVLQALKAVCGEARVQQTLNADEAACKGATLYAAALHATFRLKPFRFKDVIPSGLQMAYTAQGQAKTIEAYPLGTSQLESHKGVSLRNMEAPVSFTFSQLPSGPDLFQMEVSGMSEALEKFKAEKILDSKMKVWMDIDRTGLFKLEPPVALIQVERMVLPKQETTSNTKKTAEPTTTSATTTETPSTSTASPATTPTPAEPVPVKVMETVALKYEIRMMQMGILEEAKSLAKSEISKYRANLELQMQRATARNDVESAYYNLRSELEYETFTRWFKPEELDRLRAAIDTVSKIIDDDKPEMTKEDFLVLLEKINSAQALPMDRKDESEKRITVVPEVKNILKEAAAYSNNTLNVFEPEKRAQTNEELESLAKDATDFEAELDAKMATQSSLPDNENPVFKCAEIIARAELIRTTMKMLKKKVLPKPTPPVEPATTTPEAGQATTATEQTEQTIDPTPKEHADL